jgi:hypothetical protein
VQQQLKQSTMYTYTLSSAVLCGQPQVSLTVAKIANVGLGLASCFFPGIPTIPDDVLAKGSDILAGLDHKSSAEDFACIQVSVGRSAFNTTFTAWHVGV